MESHGAGAHVLMAGNLAVEMGVPVYGVVGMVHTAMGHEGHSVPAPGKGGLTCVSEACRGRYDPTRPQTTSAPQARETTAREVQRGPRPGV